MVYVSRRDVQLMLPSSSKFFTPGVTTLLALMVVGYALLKWLPSVASVFMLTPSSVWSGCIWQLATYPLINGGCNLAFSLFAVLFIGSAVEREWRAVSLLALWLTVSIICGLLWSIIVPLFSQSSTAYGAQACTYGLFGAFGLLFRRQRFLIFLWGMEAQFLVLILIAVGVVMSIAQPLNLIWVSGAGVAYLYIKTLWRLRSGGGCKGAAAPAESNRFRDLG